MIFVTIGGDKRGFSRLIKLMDELAGEIREEILFQIGNGKYKPKNGVFSDFFSRKEFESIISHSRVVVNDGGAGTIINALINSKPIIIFPRRKEYGEVIDDQGLDLGKVLASEGKVYIAHNKNELKKLLTTGKLKVPDYVKSEDKEIVKTLREFLELCMHSKKGKIIS